MKSILVLFLLLGLSQATYAVSPQTKAAPSPESAHMAHAAITPPSPSPSPSDSTESQTPLQAIFQGMLDWLYRPTTEAYNTQLVPLDSPEVSVSPYTAS